MHRRADLEQWPRVLVVCHASLRGESNSAQTFRSLLGDWPADRVRQVYADEGCEDGRDEHGDWCITLRSVQGYGSLRSLRPKPVNASGTGAAGVPAGIAVSGTGHGAAALAAAVGRAWADLLPFKISPGLWKWSEEFAPDVIFSPLGTIRWTTLTQRLAARHRIPIVPFICDDWPQTFYRFSRLVHTPRRVLTQRFQSALTASGVVLCGSDAMALEYRARYDVEAIGFMRCVSVAPEPPPLPSTAGRPIRFVYIGGLHLERWRALQTLGLALTRLRTDGAAATLTVYAPAADLDLHAGALERAGAIVGGTLHSSLVPAAMGEADVLVHVESFDRQVACFTRLSLSTKVPEYLAQGRPVLAMGPPGLASIEYIRAAHAGLVVDEEGEGAIESAARRLIEDEPLRTALGRMAWQAARSRHHEPQERERFRGLLSRVAARRATHV